MVNCMPYLFQNWADAILRQEFFEQRQYCVFFMSNSLVWEWVGQEPSWQRDSVPFLWQSDWCGHEYAGCSEHREYFAIFVSISWVWVRSRQEHLLKAVRQQPCEQRQYCFFSVFLVGLVMLYLFCVELVSLGMGRTFCLFGGFGYAVSFLCGIS